MDFVGQSVRELLIVRFVTETLERQHRNDRPFDSSGVRTADRDPPRDTPKQCDWRPCNSHVPTEKFPP